MPKKRTKKEKEYQAKCQEHAAAGEWNDEAGVFRPINQLKTCPRHDGLAGATHRPA